MRKTHSTMTYWRAQSPRGNDHRKLQNPIPNYRSNPKNSTPNLPPNHHLGPAALSSPFERPNFVVNLVVEHRDARRPDVNALLRQCKSKPESFRLSHSGMAVGTLYFRQWVDALAAVVWFWESRLDGAHSLIPKLSPLVIVPSDQDELRDRLRELFSNRIRRLMEGEAVEKWNKKSVNLSNEIRRVWALLKNPNRLNVYAELSEREKRLGAEKDLVEKRLKEFKSAMNSLLVHLEGKRTTTEVVVDGEGNNVKLFNLEGDYDWRRIHSLMLRECRRLEDGETGSGKSTQLVQFLADSGIGAEGSIVCTQPRKVAATSVARRVGEESSGCYGDNSITCFPAFSSAQQFDSKVIYMTDHCLLQHYMTDKNLSKISCIIVDEAHERSLNTDLLLALLKSLLCQRFGLRLIIMSATADARQLSDYFFGCGVFHVVGRNFPVDVRYVPCNAEGTYGLVPTYLYDVVRMAKEIHKTEDEGSILAFLTSQMEVEWACENFEAPAAIALPFHGKLSFDEQNDIFHNVPGKRKVIFATNLAETSLTIPGVKYVIDSGMVKESKFEPGSGMNVLRVCWISQSSANQRAGRAGRTEPGRCYRLYSQLDFEVMAPSQEPEIRRVHLGVAVLRILSLGIKNIKDFDFVDAPSTEAIDMAIRNLVQLGAVKLNNGNFELTEEGRYLVKMGVEPRLGKLILSCFNYRLGREGIVLAALMANASSIFCRVGTDEEKLKSDGLKVQFCHHNGDLFTLLSVYKQWEGVPRRDRNNWCWQNSINAKSMRRCEDTVMELESCLQFELNVIIPSYWLWTPHKSTDFDGYLKNVILSSLAENVAMYSGYDQLGYEVAVTGQHVQLHPSCSLLIFNQKPSWVVFSELLSISNQYLVCVTAFDFDFLSTLDPPPLFDASKMENRKLQVKVLTGFGGTLLKRFCGKGNSNLVCLLSKIRADCMDERIGIEVNVDQNEITLFATSQHIESVLKFVNDALECERKWMHNECLEKCLYHGSGIPSVALFGAGAEIKHLELQKRCLTVDIYYENVKALDAAAEKELLMSLEKFSSGSICSIHKFTGVGQESDDREKWGRITFLSPDAVQKAGELSQVEFNGFSLKIIPSQATIGDNKFPNVRAKVSWARRPSKGFAIVKCDMHDVGLMVNDFSNLAIGGKRIRCEASKRCMDSVVITGFDKDLCDYEILAVLRNATRRRILDFFLVRGDAVENPSHGICEALEKEISAFMPKGNPHNKPVQVKVLGPEPKDAFMRALIFFDGRLHLEAAKALEQIEGKVLPGCFPWQKIKCQQLFHTSLSCSVPVYSVIEKELDSLLKSFTHMKGVECCLDRNANGSYRVKISANATRTVAELRRRGEELINGKTIDDSNLTPAVLQNLFSRDGINLIRSLQRETGTYIFFDRHSLNVRVFGSPDKVSVAQQKFIHSLLALHEGKKLEIHLRSRDLPPDLMKAVVKKFGPDLHGLKEKVPGADFSLNARRHVVFIHGDIELKQKVEEIIYDIAKMSDSSTERSNNEVTCPICLCDIEDEYRLEDCQHVFCRSCLMEQCESAIRNKDSFPLCCAHKGCGSPLLLTDLKCLLSSEKLDDLFRASLGAFVASSGGTYRFCPTPDCPAVYRVADPGTAGEPFVCGACSAETCTSCHLEYHLSWSCETYKEFKEDPDSSLKEWRKGKEHVKTCPVCGYTIEKVEGCNHIECKCGRHICWVCLEVFRTSDDCYGHLRNIHMTII
ncbi:hypothetical protein FEM48_Zijuj08G0150600 [Ziziphus jujuba var. spinosa]|uniref:RNA helicase n=1 Tax=Ziziphus jujuba var. spinosa TaxID=714518 RepID=A0A978UZT6_ZIZJJ|nr:hypothetical protein FEM48_Zijuj08G0150600 [Ziziphus jujuba var. spinosa]